MKFRKLSGIITAFAAAALMAGCGGGGGGAAGGGSIYGNKLSVDVDLPRVANYEVYAATVYVARFDAVDYTLLGSDTAAISCSSTTSCSGSFLVSNLPSGTNYVCIVEANYGYAGSGRVAGTDMPYTKARVGAIVDSVAQGRTSKVNITKNTTAKTIVTLYYSNKKSKNLSTQVSSSDKTAIYSAVDAKLASGTISLDDFVVVGSETDMFLPSSWNNTLKTKMDGVLVAAGLDTAVDSTQPLVTSFSPISGATGVPYSGTVFKAIFNESMDSTVNLNATATLSDSNFSITISRAGGGNLTINSSNALNYGSFTWTETNVPYDTLNFTLHSIYSLKSAGLSYLKPSTTYNITSRTVPTNLKDAAGNSLNISGSSIPSTGSFTTASGPQVAAFTPLNGAQNVPYDGAYFKVRFDSSMDTSVNLNTPATLVASGFSITIVRTGGTSLTINSSNALNYGSFSWQTTTVSNDTLTFTMKSNSQLNGLKTLAPDTTYNITARTVPVNLKDTNGNPVDPATNIPSTGSFTTAF